MAVRRPPPVPSMSIPTECEPGRRDWIRWTLSEEVSEMLCTAASKATLPAGSSTALPVTAESEATVCPTTGSAIGSDLAPTVFPGSTSSWSSSCGAVASDCRRSGMTKPSSVTAAAAEAARPSIVRLAPPADITPSSDRVDGGETFGGPLSLPSENPCFSAWAVTSTTASSAICSGSWSACAWPPVELSLSADAVPAQSPNPSNAIENAAKTRGRNRGFNSWRLCVAISPPTSRLFRTRDHSGLALNPLAK